MHALFGKIHKHGLLTFFLLATLATIFDTFGFMKDANKFELIMIAKALVQSFAGLPTDENFFLVVGKLLWMLAFMSAAVSLFLKEWSYKQLLNSIIEHEHTAIIGINNFEYSYINTLVKTNTLIYNLNKHLTGYSLKENSFAVKEVSMSTILSNLKIKNMQTCVVNIGKDRDNINIAFEIIDKYLDSKYTNHLRLIVRIENRELTSFFRSNAIFQCDDYKANKIEIKTYSFFEECATNLFNDNFIDGSNNSIINSYDEYSIIIAGDGELARKVVYEAAKIAHLPNENILNIYLLSSQADILLSSLLKDYPAIQSNTLKIHTKSISHQTPAYFTDDIWQTKNLTNTIVCYDDENINLQIVATLQSRTYLREKEIKTKILFGVFNQGSISENLNKDRLEYKNFIPFGSSKLILTKENIFDDTNNLIAKFINYTYHGLTKNGAYSPNNRLNTHLEDINNKWFAASHSDQLSSLAQATHISMKLKALGLNSSPSEKTIKELLSTNRKILESKFSIQYQGNYAFPENFNNSLFDKMIRMEHNRWNTYHILNGWEYKHYLNEKTLKKQMKEIKLHNCLLPIEEFRITKFIDDDTLRDQELTKLIEWDIYSFMYIPNYLSEAGYILQESTYE